MKKHRIRISQTDSNGFKEDPHLEGHHCSLDAPSRKLMCWNPPQSLFPTFSNPHQPSPHPARCKAGAGQHISTSYRSAPIVGTNKHQLDRPNTLEACHTRSSRGRFHNLSNIWIHLIHWNCLKHFEIIYSTNCRNIPEVALYGCTMVYGIYIDHYCKRLLSHLSLKFMKIPINSLNLNSFTTHYHTWWLSSVTIDWISWRFAQALPATKHGGQKPWPNNIVKICQDYIGFHRCTSLGRLPPKHIKDVKT